MTDTLRTENGRSVLRLERRFPHKLEKVWRALTDPQQLGQWYPAIPVEMEPRLGGAIRFDYGQGTPTTAVITALDGPQLFAFTEQALMQTERESQSLLRFETHPEAGGCLLVFRQTFSDRPAAAIYAAGWQACFDALAQLLNGEPIRREPVSPDRVKAYAEAFGLVPATGPIRN